MTHNPDNAGITAAARGLRSRAVWIATVYAVFAMLWIYYSDHALAVLVSDPQSMTRWSVYKGLAFVALTTALLLIMIWRAFGALESAYAALKSSERRLRASRAQNERINRMYAALTHINQAIVRTQDRDELFDRVCDALVNSGELDLAWIGWHDPQRRVLTARAVRGTREAFARTIEVRLDSDAAGGLIARTLLEGRPHICNDMAAEPAASRLRTRALDTGFRACAMFPIRVREQVCGVLGVYAEAPECFQEQETALLEGAAGDLSFALDNAAREDERRHAESLALRERQFSQTMIESMPGILYFYNEQGRLLRWNRNFESVSGYSAQEIARMHPLDFVASEDRHPVSERIAQVFETGNSSIEAHFLARDGTRTPYYFTGRRVVFDGMDCLVGVGIDITERIEAESALRELNDTLEHKVEARTGELAAAVVRAESADRLKSAFLATMSHELRTPLNSIIGFTGIVLQGLAGPLTGEQHKQLGMVRGSAQHLLELINDVLDLSKIEADQLQLRAEPFDLGESIERTMACVMPLADKKGLNVRLELSPRIGTMCSDRRRVEQILLNLMNNAIKFTEHGTVALHASPEPGFRAEAGGAPVDAVKLTVRDTGIGIQPEDLQRLFQPFSQLDTGLARQHEGTGLGLAICKRLATLLGGTITASSQWTKGSEFTVVLPLELP